MNRMKRRATDRTNRLAEAFVLAAFVAFAYASCDVLWADEQCGTDEECLAQCSRELGRPCIDADLFGPVMCHPDDSNCDEE